MILLLIPATLLFAGISYTINHTYGIVRDNNTGLIWMRCTMLKSGINPDPLCSYTALTDVFTWDEAINKCNALNSSNYRGYSSWRLPGIRELQSIADYTWGMSPAINEKAFPNTERGYWSSTSHINSPAINKWFMDFYNGNVAWTNNKNSEKYVRCVAGP